MICAKGNDMVEGFVRVSVMVVEGISQMGVKSILEQVCLGVGLTVERNCQGKLHTRASFPLEDSL
jgi:hypothetical protein